MHVNILINSGDRATKRAEEENRKMGDGEAELRGKDRVCLYVIIFELEPPEVCLIYPERPLNRQCDILKLNLLIVFIGHLSHYVVGSSACGYPLH